MIAGRLSLTLPLLEGVSFSSARSNVLIVEYLQYFQIADRHPGHAVGPIRRALHHWLLPVGCHIGFADVSKNVLPADEALEAWLQFVGARWTENGAHAIEILDRTAVDRRRLTGIARRPACGRRWVRVRHRGDARCADRAPPNPHAFANLPGRSFPAHSFRLLRIRGGSRRPSA